MKSALILSATLAAGTAMADGRALLTAAATGDAPAIRAEIAAGPRSIPVTARAKPPC